MSKNLTRWLALIVAVGAVLYLDWLMIAPFFGVLAWATVLVIVFYPVHRRILARTNSPSWSAVVSSLLVILFILIPITLITLAVVREAAKFTDNAHALAFQFSHILDPDSPLTGPYVRWLERYVDLDQLRSQDFLIARLRGFAGVIASNTIGFVGGLLGAVVQIFFIIFTMYYLFRDGETIRKALYRVLPLEQRQARQIFIRMRDVISASVYGVLIIAIIQGTLGGLAFFALGLASPLLWGVVMTVFSLIPLAGAFVVWVPAAIYLALTGAYFKAVLLTIWGALVIGSADNFLRPKLVGGKTRLHELLIFFSVLGGLQVFGILGLVLGPVIVAVTLALLEVLRQADEPPSETDNDGGIIEGQENLRSVPDQASVHPAES